MAIFAHKLIKGATDDSSLEVHNEMARIKDSGVTEAKLGSATASGITTGAVAAKVIASTQLEALLDGNENTLFSVKAGDVILDVQLFVGTACGEAATVDIGPDGDVASSKDADGFLVNANANAAGKYLAVDTVADATAHTYSGDILDDGPHTALADGDILITSSADESASAFVGQAVMFYIPA